MRNNGNKLWRGGVIALAPFAVLMFGKAAIGEPMEDSGAGAGAPGDSAGTSTESSTESSAAPVCKDSGVTVNFATGSTSIDRNGKGALSGVATWVQNGEQRTVRLVGFADKRGNAAANQRLSEKRAQAAEDFLLGKGVNAERITVVGRGEEPDVSDHADARVVSVRTCDVPKKIAEVAPPPPVAETPPVAIVPPEPATPPEPMIPPAPMPPVAVVPPPAPAPPPAPMYEPIPPPAYAVAHKSAPPSLMGIEASLGGGAVGFIDSAARNTANTGGAWDARLTFGSRLPLAVEGAYVGSTQSIDALGLATNARLMGNGVEGDLRLNFTDFRVQPYIFGGAGWTHYRIYNSATNTSSVAGSDDVGTVPLGAGISVRPGKVFLIDVRGTYRAVFNDTMFDRLTSNTSNSMQNWNVAGRVGFEF